MSLQKLLTLSIEFKEILTAVINSPPNPVSYTHLDKLSDSDKAGVKADLDSLRAAIDSTDAENMSDADVDKIKAAKDKLMESAQNLFSKLYEQNGPGANAGTGAGTPDYSDGDVVDGDFTEV